MNPTDTATAWQQYCARELKTVAPVLYRHGYTLDDAQPHLQGERYLMRNATTTSGEKLILLGTYQDGTKVVIKAARDRAGIAELMHERTCRAVLKKIDFARAVFHTPAELAFFSEQAYTYSIQKFIEQESAFLARPLEEQFALALKAFKGQEGAHATTSKHHKLIKKTFGIRNAATYRRLFANFVESITQHFPTETELLVPLHETEQALKDNETVIEQYCGFLTHTDFVPHNIRVQDGIIYLLDHSSLTFGNKYDGWARFLNFMTLYNDPLQQALTQYVRNNRTDAEVEALRLMRSYRLVELMHYYTNTLEKSADDLLELNRTRIYFWKDVLTYVLASMPVPPEIITTYQARRDALRSDDEKVRQQGLH